MRILATCVVCLACCTLATGLFAQGQIIWNNSASTLISMNGSPMPVRTSPGTTYYFGLFIAPLGTPAPASGWAGINDPNWQFVAAYATNSTSAAGIGRMQNPGTAAVIGYDAGTNVNFIVRSWQSFLGGEDWTTAASFMTAFAQSALGTAVLGGGAISTPIAFGTGPGQIGGFSGGCLECIPPNFLVNPSNEKGYLGSNVTLNALAAHYLVEPISYQWRKQNVPITGATNVDLTLTNVTLLDAGNYDVLASNPYGSTPSDVATVTVLVPVVLGSPAYTANNQFQFTVTGAPGTNYIVQVSTNLSSAEWLAVFTNTAPFTFVDSNTVSIPNKFYRAYSR